MSEELEQASSHLDGSWKVVQPAPSALTREQEVTLSSVAHQIVVKWSQIVMGLTRHNGLCLKHDIEQLVKDFTLANDAALRARVAELEQKLSDSKDKWQARRTNLIEYYEQQLATVTAQATFTQHRFDDAIEAIDRLTKENADLRLALLDELNKKKG